MAYIFLAIELTLILVSVCLGLLSVIDVFITFLSELIYCD
jgi:hypothetical protein